MPSQVDYDQHYRVRPNACGEPFPEFVAFFGSLGPAPRRVLDLGCGQGRDALMAARLGHSVLGVDLSRIGVDQMLEQARAESLDVEGRLADVSHFRSRRRFDVVLLDRVLHLLLTDDERREMLARLDRLTRVGGFVLIADTASHRSLIRDHFDARPDEWTRVRRCADFLCVRRASRRDEKRRGS